MTVINYKFSKCVNLSYDNTDNNIYMLYDTADLKTAKTLVVSDVETVFLYIPSSEGYVLLAASIHVGFLADQLFYRVKQITYHPELKTAKIFLGP